jgi:cell shape-determining protein MreC
MSSLRFNHVFFVLMSAAFLCAFVLPDTFTDTARIHFAGVFNPLSYPARRIAEAIYHRFEPDNATDPRSRQALIDENDHLRQEVARLSVSVEQLQKLEGERQRLGDLQSLCVHVSVAGSDSGGREGLILSATSLGGLSSDDAVLYPGGLAGRLMTGIGGARVRLITDYGFTLTGAFLRFVESSDGLKPQRFKNVPTPLVQGVGRGRLAVSGMKWSDYLDAGLRPGDWVVLDDSDWPSAVQGVPLGRIVSAQQSRQAPGFADIRLLPQTDLSRLASVWVLRGE